MKLFRCREVLQKIVEKAPPRRQTALFSATWANEVERVSYSWLSNPVEVTESVLTHILRSYMVVR